LCWGMLGNVIVNYAWFITNAMPSDGLHAYGYPRGVITICLAILVAHVLLMAGALAPSGWLRIRKTAG
jgi:hypothetical protein